MPSRCSAFFAVLARNLVVLVSAIVLVGAVSPRHAAAEDPPAVTIDIFAQVPYDWKNSATGFDLSRIEYATEKNNAVFHTDLAIPYDELEELINAELKKLVNSFDSSAPNGYSYKKNFSGGSIKVAFDFDAGFEFVTTKQPHFGVQKPEDVTANRVKAILDKTSFKVWLTVDVTTTSSLGELESVNDGSVDLHATIGINTSEIIKLYPSLSIKDFKILLPVESSNFDLEGVDDELSEIGGGLGAALPITGDPISSAIIFIAGLFIGKDEALAYANDKVADVITDELEKASAMVQEEITKKFTFIDQAMEIKDEVMDQVVLPQINMTANELLEQLDGEEKLYTQVSGSKAQLLTNQRFKGTSKGVTLNGVILIPRKSCVYGGNEMTGKFAYKLDDVNTDVTSGTACSSLLEGPAPVPVDVGDDASPSPQPVDAATTVGSAPGVSSHAATVGTQGAEGESSKPTSPGTGLLNRVSSWLSGILGRLGVTSEETGNTMSLLMGSVYLGDDPADYLETEHLIRWQNVGTFSTSGKAVIKEFSIECPITISEMPRSAFLEMRAAGKLAERLGAGVPETPPLQERFFLKKQGNEERLLDHVGMPVPVKPWNYHGDPSFEDATFAIVGGVIPTDPMDCPHKGGGHKPDVDPGKFQRPGVQPDGVDLQGDVVAPMQGQQLRNQQQLLR